jgi:hypothetical protein
MQRKDTGLKCAMHWDMGVSSRPGRAAGGDVAWGDPACHRAVRRFRSFRGQHIARIALKLGMDTFLTMFELSAICVFFGLIRCVGSDRPRFDRV